MWELINSNRRKSAILFILLGLVLLLLSYLLGKAIWPEIDGAVFVFFGLFVWILMAVVAYFSGDSILLYLSHAREVTPQIDPRLYNVVEEMKIAANLPVMPKIYIIDVPGANAFATGRNLSSCAIAVTAGLLTRLKRDELQGVIAHEMSHIINRDILYMTFAGVTLGCISLLSYWFLRGAFRVGGSSRRFRTKSSGDGRLQLILILVAIAGAIIGPVLARILYYSISRKREYLADASAVRLTRYPEGLASALEKLVEDDSMMMQANPITAPMYIVNPVRKRSLKFWGLAETHPPVEDRIKILRKMTYGAGYQDYQGAYKEVFGRNAGLIPESSLKDKARVPIRDRMTDTDGAVRKSPGRELGDLLKAVNDFIFLTCSCGLILKLPPQFKDNGINCPRCKKLVTIPFGNIIAAAAVLGGIESSKSEKKQSKIVAEDQVIEFKKTGRGWETFTCVCRKKHNLSPVFEAKNINCSGCGRIIKFID